MKFFTRSQISEVNEEKVSRAVDINYLLASVRKKKEATEQNKYNFIWHVCCAHLIFRNSFIFLITYFHI